MRQLRPGWYIVLYHDISWEENCYIRSIGGTCPPDLFRRHVSTLAELGELVSIPLGMERLRQGTIATPMFSFWFDDGMVGVRKYAAPILKEFKVTGALSICSRFINRTEFFWRFKLSYLNSVDGMRLLRTRLRKHGYKTGESVRTFTLDNFSREVLEYVDELFVRFTSTEQREDAFRIFDSRDGILSLHQQGWTIANHTAGHYPISREHSLHLLETEFLECEREIEGICGTPSDYWVLPFGRHEAPNLIDVANRYRENRHIVFVGNRVNRTSSMDEERALYRIGAPVHDSAKLLENLAAAAQENNASV